MVRDDSDCGHLIATFIRFLEDPGSLWESSANLVSRFTDPLAQRGTELAIIGRTAETFPHVSCLPSLAPR